MSSFAVGNFRFEDYTTIYLNTVHIDRGNFTTRDIDVHPLSVHDRPTPTSKHFNLPVYDIHAHLRIITLASSFTRAALKKIMNN